ncbi:MAG TPA: molybdopterin-dependent oxidoreductase [Blastocatellia bacterium]|nr:molybdopterin-dependent oxidoreductase [Blastocatellia bacterium]
MSSLEKTGEWLPTACILCSRNCGIEVEVRGREMTRIRGDKAHPISTGYLCQKAQRLNYYQNHADRLTSPLRRREDGSFEEISWETAVSEIAARLLDLRDRFGGRSLAYFGGGGQGNHLAGPYGKALRTAMRTRNYYSALAQEKTGGFWVDGRLFGKQNCHPTEDVDHAEVVVFIGTNPWQSHGIRNARQVLREIHNDPSRRMIVIDPRRTETAELADLHLEVKPGADAFLLAAILAVIVRERREATEFISNHTTGFETVREELLKVPVEAFAARAGVAVDDVYLAAQMIAGAASCAVRTDLGIEQSLNSTLNLYLRSLMYLITGNFAKPGGNNLHTSLIPLIGHSPEGSNRHVSAVNGFPFIGNLLPPNILPSEIDTDHEERTRGLVVDSANPVVTMADTKAYRKAFAKLDLLVVIDVAMTETAELAHYVLPAPSQFEKWEATFFNLEFPANAFHLRKPLFEPMGNTLPEPEIYARLVEQMGALPKEFPELAEAARASRLAFAMAFQKLLAEKPELADYAPVILYRTLGPTLPEDAGSAAFLWATAHQFARKSPDAVRRAGHTGDGVMLGENLFEAILSSRSGVVFSVSEYEESWSFIKHADGRIHLEIPEMLRALRELDPAHSPELTDYPFILVAGERRSYNANTIYRDPNWRKTDPDGALKIHPEDALALGLIDGGWARCESKRGSVVVRVEVSDSVGRGQVTLPHGYGMMYPGSDGKRSRTGAHINELTAAEDRDPVAGTPYHKFIPVRLAPIEHAQA